MKSKLGNFHIACMILLFSLTLGCKKIISVHKPTDTITSSQVFSTDDQATSAAAGMYYSMVNGYSTFFNGGITFFTGLSSDELETFTESSISYFQFQNNDLLSVNPDISQALWANAYSSLYTANSIIEGLSSNSAVTDSVKNELIGEAKFIRALTNFYLTNLFGDIPLAVTINWHNTGLLKRTPVAQTYQSIIEDLKDSQSKLPANYSVGKGERVIPNKFAATALLARVYLYNSDWKDAADQSTALITNPTLVLNTNLDDVFKKNSSESIWQLKQNNKDFLYNSTPEGFFFIPQEIDADIPPNAYLSSQLLNSFEHNDLRFANWVDSTLYTPTGVEYYFPHKYKIGVQQAIPNGPYTEYYTVLRLAEQYLIRAEARAMQNDIGGAIEDLNSIRLRSGLSGLPSSLSQSEILAEIEQENKIEFFAEWGHRWMDLKRWGKANEELSILKGMTWQPSDQLYPIPAGEISTDPNLTQNPGY